MNVCMCARGVDDIDVACYLDSCCRSRHGKAMSDMEAKLAEEVAARKEADKQLKDMRERYDVRWSR